jgi:hypothetical protein
MKLKETIKKILKEETNSNSKIQRMIDEVGLATTIKFFGGFSNFYDRVGNDVITRQHKIDFIKDYFITNRQYFVQEGGNLFNDYGEQPILFYEDDEQIKQIEAFDNNVVYVDLYVKDEDGDSWSEVEELPYEDVPEDVLNELFYFVMDAFKYDNGLK